MELNNLSKSGINGYFDAKSMINIRTKKHEILCELFYDFKTFSISRKISKIFRTKV